MMGFFLATTSKKPCGGGGGGGKAIVKLCFDPRDGHEESGKDRGWERKSRKRVSSLVALFSRANC